MLATDLIRRKRDGDVLSGAEIRWSGPIVRWSCPIASIKARRAFIFASDTGSPRDALRTSIELSESKPTVTMTSIDTSRTVSTSVNPRSRPNQRRVLRD